MKEQRVTGGSTRLGDPEFQPEDEVHVRVRKVELLIVLDAAQQLHSTPLTTAQDHERLGRAINAIRGRLESEKPFSKQTRLHP